MERNPTARAMEWSVELEKGLRAKEPLQRLQAISEFGPKLLQWSREPRPHPSRGANHLFDLIPGEDRLFANAALLRLALAFTLGDCPTRVCVVEVFLAEYRDRAKRRGSEGLLSKERVSNSSELLGRIKAVFDNGDVESKSLALGLLGCWAGFASESSNIRYLVLSSMVSPHVSEAKAALFAAGCFCEVSDDFPFVVLEMLLNLMTSSETSPPVRLTAARVYAKLGNSYSIATKSYKTGLKILLESSEEEFQVALLVSLSKIASRLSTLIPDQVHLLVSFLSQEKSLRVRATALRSLLFIFSKVCQLSIDSNLVKVLFEMLDEPELPENVQREALRVLHKTILCTHPRLPCVLYLDKLTTIAEKASISPFTSTSHLAIRVLVDVSKRFEARRDMGSGLSCRFPIPPQVVLIIVRHITSLVKPLVDRVESLKFHQLNHLLTLLLSIVQEDQDLAILVVDQIVVLVRYVGSMNGKDCMDTIQTDALVQDNGDSEGEKSKAVTLKLLCKVHRLLVRCLECLNEAGADTRPVFDKVKLLVENVCESKVLDSYTHTIYSMLLHSLAIQGHNMNENEKSRNLEGKHRTLLQIHSVEHELIMFEFTKKILAENKNWIAYKVGTYLAGQGAWFSSSHIFQHLVTRVHSDSCCYWLRSLFHFSSSGRKTTLMLLAGKFSSLVDMTEATKLPLTILSDDLEEIGHDSIDPFYKLNISKVVLSAYRSVCFAKEALEVNQTSGEIFCFQRWFLSLRAKTFQAVVNVLETLETALFLWEKNSRSWEDEKNLVVERLSLLGRLSLSLKSLAKEYDLLSASFIDMDRKSSKFISALALAVSLLGFITSFSFFIPCTFDTTSDLKKSKDSICAHLVQDLARRLWYIDLDISTKLYRLIDDGTDANINCVHLQSRNHPLNDGSEAGDILNVCGNAVSEISCLRSEADRTKHEDNASRVLQDGLRITFKLLNMWMQIPFRVPNYFFRFRPCIGSELFATSINKNTDAICVSLGYHLPLSACLQLRNVPLDIPVRPAKFHCMLYSTTSFQETSERKDTSSSHQGWETDDMVEMNEKLLRHVKNYAVQNVNNRMSTSRDIDDCGFVSSFICCEPNEMGQGFSTCSLDVSGFPIGSYRIKWQCCCLDNEGNYWNLLPLNAGPVFTVK